MVVAFPKGACTGTANAIFLDDAGNFVSAIAPGTAANLVFPEGARRVFEVSNFDVEASPGTRFFRQHVALSSEHGIVLDVPRRDGRNCANRGVPRPVVVTASEARTAAESLVWLEPDPRAGAAWLAEHRVRVQELVDVKASAQPND